MTWHPTFGAWPERGGTRFRVWASGSARVSLVLEPGPEGVERPLTAVGDGVFETFCPDVAAGARYRYRLDGKGPYPDPASRYQPDGVHGPSAVVDPRAYQWSDASWQGRRLEELVVYELHVGTFTPEGTFASAASRLPYLANLGITAVELMPLADWPGERNWGYDGVALFAPARCYGTPDDLRRLVDTAHGFGLAVLLDVVYNHLGPDGAYLAAFSPAIFSTVHESPWGAGINLDGPGSRLVRRFFIDNAQHWLHEYRFDGLRLDATHALVDDSPQHFLAELADDVRGSAAGRTVHLVAEDHRNLATLVLPRAGGGFGLDGVWADDFHHAMRRVLAGDSEGYYRDFSGTTGDVAGAVREGWLFTGQHSAHFDAPRGTPTDGIPLERFVICLQNHDQVGNRALGERVHQQIDAAAWRGAMVVLLCAPETPLLFMGQEWAARSPFLYFTDHEPGLGRLVTEGRRNEFRHFAAFTQPDAAARIPDPQARATFESSRLRWDERAEEPHAAVLRLSKALLALRRSQPALFAPGRHRPVVSAVDGGLVMGVGDVSAGAVWVAARLRGAGHIDLGSIAAGVVPPGHGWRELLNTESPLFVGDPLPISVTAGDRGPVVDFSRPGAVVFHTAVREIP